MWPLRLYNGNKDMLDKHEVKRSTSVLGSSGSFRQHEGIQPFGFVVSINLKNEAQTKTII